VAPRIVLRRVEREFQQRKAAYAAFTAKQQFTARRGHRGAPPPDAERLAAAMKVGWIALRNR
jgi:hypothetical protein